MLEEVRHILSGDGRIAYALLFGSFARGTAHPRSDLDIAIGLTAGVHIDPLDLGGWLGALEAGARRSVDLVVLDEAGPALAFRVFRDGRAILVRDREALVRRKARAIVEHLDFKPVETLCADGVLAAARGR